MGIDPLSLAIMAATTIISAGISIYTANRIDTDVDDIGSTVTKSGTSASRNPVYGTCRTGAVAVYNNVDNNNSENLLNVFACGIGVTGIRQVYIDDVEVLVDGTNLYLETSSGGYNQLRFSGNQLQNGFEKQCEVQIRAGLDTGVPMQLAIDYGDGEWTSDMRGDRVCALAIKSKRIIDDEEVRIMSETFAVSLLVDGLPLHDPRIHATTDQKAFSSNGALAILDYITDTYYGMGIKWDYIDTQSFIEAANWCDLMKVEVHGQLDSSATFSDNLDALLQSTGLALFTENGYITLRYEDVELPSHDFDESNVINGSLTVTEQSTSDYNNVIEAEYKNTELNDEQDTFTVPADVNADPQVISDGYVQSKTLNMSLTRIAGSDVNDADSTVKLLANRELIKGQYQKQVEFDIDLSEHDVRIFDVITLSNIERKWVNKEFRITAVNKSVTNDAFNIGTISCVEYADEIYNGTANGGGGSGTPQKPQITAPTGLAFNLQDYVTDGFGTLSWSRTWYETNCEHIVEYKTASSPTWTRVGRTKDSSWQFPIMPADTYDFRVATFSNFYGTSAFAELNGVVIDSIGILPQVTGLTLDFSGKDCLVDWDDMMDSAVTGGDVPRKVREVFSHYRVSVFDNTASPVLIGTYQSSAHEYRFTLEQNLPKARDLQVSVEIVAIGGTLSTPATTTVTNSQHSQASGFNADASLSTVIVTWDDTYEPDYHRAIVERDSTGTFSGDQLRFYTNSSPFTDILPAADPDGSIYFYRVGLVDVLGEDSINYTPAISVTKSDVELPEFPDDLADLRDPEKAQSATGELAMSVTTPTGKTVAGIGWYADDLVSEYSRVIVAADEFIVAAGGHAKWSATEAYDIGDRVTVYVSATEEQMWEALTANTGVTPVEGADWTLVMANTYQSAFAIDSVTNELLVNNATIKDLDASSITTGTLGASVIYGGEINGEQVNVSSELTVGTGNDVAKLSGSDATYRLWAGNATASSAPFRVDQSGNMTATSATITGSMTATSGRISGTFYLGSANNSTDYAVWYGASNPSSDGESFRMMTDGKYRRREWYDGRSIWYKSDGSSYFLDINPNTDSARFYGTIYADKINGDIVTARRYSASDETVTTTTWTTFDTVTVSGSTSYARTLVITVVLEGYASRAQGSSGSYYATAQARATGAFGTVYSQVIDTGKGYKSSTSTEAEYLKSSTTVQLHVNVAANTTGTMSIQVSRLSGAGSSATATVKGTSGTSWVAQLFRNGSDLS